MAIVHQTTSLWGPFLETYDMTGITAVLAARIAIVNVNATALTKVQAILTKIFTTIGEDAVLKVSADGGTTGVLADKVQQLNYWKEQLSAILGFYMPKGTPIQETRRKMGRGFRVVR